MEYTVHKGTWAQWLDDVNNSERELREQSSQRPNGSLRMKEWRGKVSKDDREFYGTNSYAEALTIARTGRAGMAAAIGDQAERLRGKLPRLMDRFTRRYDVAGGRVDPVRLRAGDPRPMVRRQPAAGTPVVKVAVHACYMAAVKTETVTTVGAWMVALVDALTAARYGVQLDVIFAQGEHYHGTSNDPVPGRQEAQDGIRRIVVTLKPAGERADIGLIGSALTNASTLRVFAFESFMIEAERRKILHYHHQGFADNSPSPDHDITLWVPYPASMRDRKDSEAHTPERMIETALETFLASR